MSSESKNTRRASQPDTHSHHERLNDGSYVSQTTLQRVWSAISFRPTFDSKNFLLSTTPRYPYLLPVLRLLFATYMLAISAIYFSTNVVDVGKFFFFLTNLSYLTLLVYFLITGVHSILALRLPHRFGPQVEHPQLYLLFIQMLYSINLPVHFLITVVYWPIIHPHFVEMYKPDFLLHWINVSVHALAFAFCLVEFCLNHMHFYPVHVIIIVNAGLFYVCMLIAARFIFMVDGVPYYPYLFLAWEQPLSPLFHVAIFFFAIFAYLVVTFAHRLKYTHFVDPLTARSSAVAPIVYDEEATVADPSAAHTKDNFDSKDSPKPLYPSIQSTGHISIAPLPVYTKAESMPHSHPHEISCSS